MPLSKARDKERKRLARLENQNVQPKTPVATKLFKTRHKRRDEMTSEELGITGHDADGYPLYDD